MSNAQKQGYLLVCAVNKVIIQMCTCIRVPPSFLQLVCWKSVAHWRFVFSPSLKGGLVSGFATVVVRIVGFVGTTTYPAYQGSNYTWVVCEMTIISSRATIEHFSIAGDLACKQSGVYWVCSTWLFARGELFPRGVRPAVR